MKITATLLLLVLAIVCFVLSAFNVPRLNWFSAGWAFVVAAFIFQ